MENTKTVTMNGIAVAELNKGHISVWAIVGGTDGKQRRISYDGYNFTTYVWKNGSTYGASSRCDQLSTKIYGKEFASFLGEELRAFFFEVCALEWKAYLEKTQANYDAKGYGVVPQPEKLAEVNAYLAAQAAKEAPKEEEGPIVNRYVASPYSYYGDSSRARSWAIWDRKTKGWLQGVNGAAVATKKDAEALAASFNANEGEVDPGSQPSDDVEAYSPWAYLADAQREIDEEEERRERGRW